MVCTESPRPSWFTPRTFSTITCNPYSEVHHRAEHVRDGREYGNQGLDWDGLPCQDSQPNWPMRKTSASGQQKSTFLPFKPESIREHQPLNAWQLCCLDKKKGASVFLKQMLGLSEACAHTSCRTPRAPKTQWSVLCKPAC